MTRATCGVKVDVRCQCRRAMSRSSCDVKVDGRWQGTGEIQGARNVKSEVCGQFEIRAMTSLRGEFEGAWCQVCVEIRGAEVSMSALQFRGRAVFKDA
jgi:hypothetical protein